MRPRHATRVAADVSAAVAFSAIKTEIGRKRHAMRFVGYYWGFSYTLNRAYQVCHKVCNTAKEKLGTL